MKKLKVTILSRRTGIIIAKFDRQMPSDIENYRRRLERVWRQMHGDEVDVLFAYSIKTN